MKRLRPGVYTYGKYEVRNHGYYPPDHCVWWEAVNQETGEADFRGHTKREIRTLIDKDEALCKK